MFGTLFSNRDSVISIHNHWVPLKKILFYTSNLSEIWNPNLNFMWVPWQIWEQPRRCFWIQSGFKSGLSFMWVLVLLPLLGPIIFLPCPCFLSLWKELAISGNHGGLASTELGLGDDVSAKEYGDDNALLDRRGLIETLAVDAMEEFFLESHVVEACHHLNLTRRLELQSLLRSSNSPLILPAHTRAA